MKRKILLTILLISQLASGYSKESLVPRQIEDPLCIAINKLPARSMFAYPKKQELQSLNGKWLFSWASEPQSRAIGFYNDDYDRSLWTTIDVPSTMERQGYGVTHYVNSVYPFKPIQPLVMLEPSDSYTSFIIRNPVGSFYRTFTISPEWQDKQIILHFGGVSSAAFVWINGERVGYTQGSRLPSEFDITKYLRKGENSIAVEVYKYSDSSYLEDQDFWRMSGIYREVFLEAKSKQALWDIYAEPKLNKENRSGEVILHYNTSNLSKSANAKLSMTLYAPDGSIVVDQSSEKIKINNQGISGYKSFLVAKLPKVALWYEEDPQTYSLEVKLTIGNESVEKFTLPLGFRYIDVQHKNVITYNDVPLKIKGVNRHEFSPDQGWVISNEEMKKDIELMKKGNVNFVRTSHYPNEPEWYHLCNKYGMMVMDEANVESHGVSYHNRILPADDPAWSAAVVDRMRRMVIRDRQNPSVVMWSLGNEAGFGNAFMEMRKVTHELDPERRLIQYADMNLAADMDSRTYPNVRWLGEQVLGIAKQVGERGEKEFPNQHGVYPTGKPFITNEFAHAMGNSLGNFVDFYDKFYSEPMLGGGFIWDWVDQALWLNPKKGESSGFIYGGDNGDYPTDYNMLINGIVSASREPHPHYYEMKKVFQSIAILQNDNNKFDVINRFYKKNLNEFDFEYEIISDGVLVDKGQLDKLDVEPYDTLSFTLPQQIKFDEGKETFVKFNFLSREDKLWLSKGDVIAWEQFKLSDGTSIFKKLGKPQLKLQFNESEHKYICSGNDFILSINKESGMIDGLHKDGFPVIFRPTMFNFYRVPTDNDRGWKMPTKMKVWHDAETDYTLDNIEVLSKTDSEIVIRASYIFKQVHSKGEILYTVTGDGTIEVDFNLDMDKESTQLACVGLQFDIHQTLEQIEWYGRGPQENYYDRKTGAAIGLYRDEVEDWVTPYVRPQSNANRTDVRHITFKSPLRKSLQFIALDKPFEVSAWPYSSQMLESAAHDFELGRYNGNIVNILGAQQGVGGDSSWSQPIMPKYQLPVQDYRVHFVIK